MEKLRKKCESVDKEIQDQHNFKDFYMFTFNFAKNPGQKSLGEQALSPDRSIVIVTQSGKL